MKTKQTKINRSGAALLPGAMALAAATAGSQAATVQITLTGNKISSIGGNQLFADLTGDGTPDQTVINGTVQYGLVAGNMGPAFATARASVRSSVDYDAGLIISTYFYANVGVGAGGLGGGSAFQVGSPLSLKGLHPFTFSDTRVNGGVLTEAWLELHAFNTNSSDHTVEFTRVIFDDASTTRPVFTEIPGVQTEWAAAGVPEPSSFGMLALGAGGLLARRRRAKQAA